MWEIPKLSSVYQKNLAKRTGRRQILPCPFSLKKKAKRWIKPWKDRSWHRRQNTHRALKISKQWKAVRRSTGYEILLSWETPCLNKSLNTYEVQVCDRQVDKTQDIAHKNSSLVCWSTTFSAIDRFLYPLKGEADIPREEYLTSLYIDIELCDKS